LKGIRHNLFIFPPWNVYRENNIYFCVGTANIFSAVGHAVWLRLQSTHRVAMATLWRTVHHDGKISPAWWACGGSRPPPFTISTIMNKVVVYAPAERADTLPLLLLYPFTDSVIETFTNVLYVKIAVENTTIKTQN
jgi:hypothetical protein